MSAHFRAQLKLAYEDSQEFLTDKETFPVPPQNGQSDLLYAKSIRSLFQSLDDHTSDVKSALMELETNSDRWMSLRTNMTGTERALDNPLYDAFVVDFPFPKAISDLKKYLRILRTERRALEAVHPTANTQNGPAPSLVHLPKTTLPTFSGDCTNYLTFWNTFKAGVHDLNIPNSLKFTYLKQCLSGPPLTLINSLPISDDSYDSAISLLSQHYENPEEVARALHNSLRKLPRIRTGDYFCEDLRSLLDQLESICIQMPQQNHSYDTVAVQMEVEERLPRFVLDEVFMAKENDDNWSSDKLKSRLWAILKRKEPIQTLLPKMPSSPRPKFPMTSHSKMSSSSPQQADPPLPTLTFHSKKYNQSDQRGPTEKFKPKPKLPCLFCDDPNHFSTHCTNYNDPKTRSDRLKALKRCFKCLKSGHFSRQCMAPAQCSNCKGTHPRALCENSGGYNRCTNYSHFQQSFPALSGPSQITSQFSSPPPISLPPEIFVPPTSSDDVIPKSQTNTAISASHRPILLKCVNVTFFYPQNRMMTRQGIALLDDASTHSYIDFNEAKALNLSFKSTSVKLGVFNDNRCKTLKTFSTKFGLQLTNGRSLIISASAVGTLTQPTFYMPFSPDLFSDVELVNEIASVRPIILLGADFYYEVEPTPIQRLPTVIHTLLGPIVAGAPNRFPPTSPVQFINFSSQIVDTEPLTPPSDFFTLEGIGIRDDPQPLSTDDYVLNQFNGSIQFVENRYQVKLPFRSDPKTLPLPSNFGLCFGRLRSVFNTLSKQPDFLQKYDSIIQEQKSKGFCLAQLRKYS